MVNCSGREGSTARHWDCEEIAGVLEWGGDSRGRRIWCPPRPWRALTLGTLDGIDAEPGPYDDLGVEIMIGCLLIDVTSRLKHQFIDRL